MGGLLESPFMQSNQATGHWPYLQARGVFDGFTGEEMAVLEHYGHVGEILEGETIIRQAAVQGSFYVILDGRVRVIRQPPSGVPEILAELEAGDGFGEMALLNPPFASATVVAVTPVVFWHLTRAELQEVLTKQPDLGEQLFNSLVRLYGSRL